jgi:hypothetical protein
MGEPQESLETKPHWDHRRTQRVLMDVPVLVYGNAKDEGPFQEQTRTLQVSAHGGLITMTNRVKRGQKLLLTNAATKESQECYVIWVGKRRGNRYEVGIGFTHPAPRFWHISFPPPDWKRSAS